MEQHDAFCSVLILNKTTKPGPMSVNGPPERHFLRYLTSLSAVAQEATHRRDFVLPLKSSRAEAMLSAVLAGSGHVGTALLAALGPDATLQELNVIISEPGAKAQDTHADSGWSATDPRLITLFIPLHDILDETWNSRARQYRAIHVNASKPKSAMS